VQRAAVVTTVVIFGTQVALGVVAAAQDDEIYDGRSTESTVDLVTAGLVGIAALTALLGLAFFWHTSPRRRRRRAE